MKKINCPMCNKELIRLELFEKDIYEFWCDDCDIDISITDNNEKVDWFAKITEKLRDYPEGDIWSAGDEILCKTEDAANALADMLESLYKAQGEEILVNTGYYDPEEDERHGEIDRYTGWWYVNID